MATPSTGPSTSTCCSPVPGRRLPGIHINFWLVLHHRRRACARSCGIIIGAPTLRLRSDYLALVTLGFGEIITQFFRNGDDIVGQQRRQRRPGHLARSTRSDRSTRRGRHRARTADQLRRRERLEDPGSRPARRRCCIFVSLRIREGRLGRAWLAIREDELAASMMGVPLMRTKLLAYAVGAFSGGVGGVANASIDHARRVSPSGFNFGKSILVLADGGARRHGQRLGRDRRCASCWPG